MGVVVWWDIREGPDARGDCDVTTGNETERTVGGADAWRWRIGVPPPGPPARWCGGSDRAVPAVRRLLRRRRDVDAVDRIDRGGHHRRGGRDDERARNDRSAGDGRDHARDHGCAGDHRCGRRPRPGADGRHRSSGGGSRLHGGDCRRRCARGPAGARHRIEPRGQLRTRLVGRPRRLGPRRRGVHGGIAGTGRRRHPGVGRVRRGGHPLDRRTHRAAGGGRRPQPGCARVEVGDEPLARRRVRDLDAGSDRRPQRRSPGGRRPVCARLCGLAAADAARVGIPRRAPPSPGRRSTSPSPRSARSPTSSSRPNQRRLSTVHRW